MEGKDTTPEERLSKDQIVFGLRCLNGDEDRICGRCPIYRIVGARKSCRHIILEQAIEMIEVKK